MTPPGAVLLGALARLAEVVDGVDAEAQSRMAEPLQRCAHGQEGIAA